MELSAEHFCVNVSELKARLAKRLGTERAMRYFSCLNGLLSRKVGKSEFDRVCSRILGRENLSLHNQLIRSILHNACQAKSPPPRASGILLKKSFRKDDRVSNLEVPGPPVQTFVNGHIMSPSPRKSRNGIQNSGIKDQLRAPGLNGRTEGSSYQPGVPYDEAVLRGNGDPGLYDLKISMQHKQGTPAEQSIKKSKVEKVSLPEANVVGSWEDQDRNNDLMNSRAPLRAPLGVPLFTASIGGAQNSIFLTDGSSSYFRSCCGTGELCETEALKKRMEKIAEAQGLEGVTVDCANLLNNGLDTYLKRLITTCAELVSSRTTHEAIKQPVSKLQSQVKHMNDVHMGNHKQIENIGAVSVGNHESKRYSSITMQDLLVAMELKPHQLGEDWPLLLERICLRSFEK